MEVAVRDKPVARAEYRFLKVEQLNPTLGAYVSGVDLTGLTARRWRTNCAARWRTIS